MTASNVNYYHYDPSLAAAVLFLFLFFSVTNLHVYQLLRTRTWYFIPFVIGGFLEWMGYIGRVFGSQQTPNWTLLPYIVQVLFLLLAPVLFAASIYMDLARIIVLTDGEACALIRPRRLTMTFVLGDVLSFVLQSAGGTLMSSRNNNGNSQSHVKTGQKIVVGGLGAQILFFGCFLLVAVLFHKRILRAPTAKSLSDRIPWRKHLIALYMASILILVRSVFRTVEFIQGRNGYILSHEWFLYAFDSILMLAVMVIFHVVHPSEVKALLRGGKVSRGGWKVYDVSASKGESEAVTEPQSA